MTGQGGAGASVSSGAGYQARVAAYAILASICRLDTEFGEAGSIIQVGFEVKLSVDDINLVFRDGSMSFVQAKAAIDFSLANGELRSVLSQFEGQDATATDKVERYLLVTSSRASKKVTFDLRGALDAFRSSPEADFFRDQPKALTDILTDLKTTLNELRVAAGRQDDPEAANRILRKSHVLVLDVEVGDPLAQAMVLVLQAKHYVAASAVWGKAVADCVAYAKGRRTIAIDEIEKAYERFRVAPAELSQEASDDLLRIEFGELNAPSGKDIVLCRTADDNLLPKGHLVIIELVRFNYDCGERIDFEKSPLTLSNGLQFELLFRAATDDGLTRILEARPDLVADQELVVLEMNRKYDPQSEPCAAAHSERLRNALRRNDNLLRCLRCGQAVSETVAPIVEMAPILEPVVGLVHDHCLSPTDRVIGGARSPFAEKYPELVNFDANAWFRVANGGQRAFDNLELLRPGPVSHMAWGGDRPVVQLANSSLRSC